MAEISTIARPYSQAVFELAQSQKKLTEWSQMLGFLASVVTEPHMQSLISNTSIKKEQLTKLMDDICSDKLDDAGRNLIKVLMENRRLGLMPEISNQFETLRADAEGTIEAELVCAFDVTDAQLNKISKALQKRLGRKVSLKAQVDNNLIGGAIVRAGDVVIDGSAVGRLEKLSTALSY
ncbi:MAG: F0F1 ATP synthase subunit delta [Gammaproteobacteria bacterium]|nr:F0F1 ATP synthase subunit delta [Gammaproteobacteria bacterium]